MARAFAPTETSTAASGDGLGALLRRPFTAEGIIVSVALAIPFALARWVIPLGDSLVLMVVSRGLLLIYLGALASYYFQTVSHIGLGRAGLPFSSADDREALVRGGVRGLVCLVVGVGPGIATSLLVGPPLSVVVLVLGLLLVPASILAIVMGGNAASGLWPPALASVIARVPGAYAKLALVFVLSTVVWGVVMTLVAMSVGQIPLLGSFVVGATNNVLLLAQALVVGNFLHRHAADLGHT